MRDINKKQFDNFEKRAAIQNYIPSWAVKKESLADDVPVYELPLADYFIDSSDSKESFLPRTFYHESSLDKTDYKLSSGVPRCGFTGLFFAREEVVDNLQAAGRDLGYSSPFWIRAEHPALKSGFLKMKNGGDSICISLTSNVISIDDVEAFDSNLLHPSLRPQSKSTTFYELSKKTPLGMNAITGFVSKNPFYKKLPHKGLWLSQEQVLQHGIKVPPAAKREKYVLVEVDQWEMFNADQLAVPGRLGLRKCIEEESNTSSVFQRS
ncbi:hypothetical protein STCU_05378 [Strigomonas culicis]|nr:hypothetical protein STCU_05378 [Strigomonas culicis]|eukprot:EPY27959.1 hypothetical protein STCU_05378 [Strigomonas culicis]